MRSDRSGGVRRYTPADGSIGCWYTLHLPLEAGDNELAIAVSEDLGGWGVQARFTDEADAPDPA